MEKAIILALSIVFTVLIGISFFLSDGDNSFNTMADTVVGNTNQTVTQDYNFDGYLPDPVE